MRCFYCTKEMLKALKTRDHVIPLSKGGRKGAANIVPACKPCNGAKGSDDAVAFFDRKTRELGLSADNVRRRRRTQLERIILAGQPFIPEMLAQRQAKHETTSARIEARINAKNGDGPRLSAFHFVAAAEADAQKELAKAIGRRTRRKSWLPNVLAAVAQNT